MKQAASVCSEVAFQVKGRQRHARLEGAACPSVQQETAA